MTDEEATGENSNPYWHPDIKPHAIEGSDVENLSLQCLHIMLASHSAILLDIDEDGKTSGSSRLRKLHLASAEKNLSKALLQIAVSARTFDDLYVQADDQGYIEHLKAVDAEGPYATSFENGGDLGIRECCNKIIHAQDFRPVYERDDDHGENAIWYMNTQIELMGERNGKSWSYTLDTIQFLDAVLDLLAYGH